MYAWLFACCDFAYFLLSADLGDNCIQTFSFVEVYRPIYGWKIVLLLHASRVLKRDF